MNRFNSLRPVIVMLVAAGNLALPSGASAVERAHFSRGTAQFTSLTAFDGAGNASHLGRYTEEGNVQFSGTADPYVLQIDGSVTYTSDKGDELDATVTGLLNTQTGAITATLTYDGGTGRFEFATGSATLTGQMQFDGTISVTVKGRIDY